jgi:hypothetical protein
MKRLISATTLVLLLVAGRPALGWNPYRDDPDFDWPQPVAWTPEPAPVAPPPGVYLVTETYAGDSVTRAGDMTTYSTETVHEVTGSYARVLESVGTGRSSAFDGAAFNGRAALTDGRGVAGTYYENYVRTDGGFVPVSVVFFQDDQEIARASTPVQQPPVAPQVPAPVSVAEPVIVRNPSPAAVVTPVFEREEPLPVPITPPARASLVLPDRSVEVLRGRRTTLSISGQDVRAWRFLSGETVALGALTGTGGEPFVARWDRLAPPNATWAVRFIVDYADGTSHELVVRVAVRAPGLVE